MNIKKTLRLLLLILGEALIIICFIYFGRNLESKILTLNITVSSIIYALIFIEMWLPWFDFKDKSNKIIGSLGVRWFFTFFYAIVAIAAMVIFNIGNPININSQTILQGVLFFFLLLGLYFALISADKVQQVFEEEKQVSSRLQDVIKLMKEVQLRLEIKKMPDDIIARITSLQESLRFISPCNNPEAQETEVNFANELNAIQNSLLIIPINQDIIIEHITNCERVYKQRKLISSN